MKKRLDWTKLATKTPKPHLSNKVKMCEFYFKREHGLSNRSIMI